MRNSRRALIPLNAAKLQIKVGLCKCFPNFLKLFHRTVPYNSPNLVPKIKIRDCLTDWPGEAEQAARQRMEKPSYWRFL